VDQWDYNLFLTFYFLFLFSMSIGDIKNINKKASDENMGARTRSVAHQQAQVKEVEEMVAVTMSETDTEILLSLPSLVMTSEAREVVQVEESNARYEALLESRSNLDGFTEHNTQTLNYPQKNQNEMVAPNASQDMGAQAYSYDISDAISKEFSTNTETDTSLVTDNSEKEVDTGLSPHVLAFVQSTVNLSINTPGCLLDALAVNASGSGHVSNNKKSSNKSQAVSMSDNGSKSKSHANNGSNVQLVGGETLPGHSGVGNTSSPGNLSGAGEEDTFNSHLEDDAMDYGSHALKEANKKAILNSDGLMKRLQMVERAVQQNAHHEHILDYRSLPEVDPLVLQSSQDKVAVVDSVDQLFGGGLKSMAATTVAVEEPPAIEKSASANDSDSPTPKMDDEKIKKLFTYAAPSLVRGRTVTCMAWNAENTDLLAVGYGRVDFVEDSTVTSATDASGKELNEEDLASGLVLFWSIRNPGFPEKVLHTPHAVTALDFSRRNTTLLAVGFYNGDIAVYDVRRDADWEKPMESSIGMPGSHSDPVWQVKWLSKGHDRVDTLISISTDGNVLQWSLKKGLLVSLLMQLKRGGAGEGWISRQASGLCFDFAPDEHGTYITGTEEGDIHRCSISYNEQYLDTYEPHSGPVYRLRFSPSWGDVFLSCSADWTMSLFHMRSNSPLLTFHAGGEDFSINDISWCPQNSTIFGAVTADAKLQIWDIAVSDIDPVITLDTNIDLEDDEVDVVDPSAAAGGPAPGTSSGPRKSTAAGGTRQSYSRADRLSDEGGNNDNSAPVAKLLKNLKSGAGNRRTLTSLLFSENSPVMVVGDSKGNVTVYRVRDDIITSPTIIAAEQTSRLKQAVWRSTDPAEAAKLQTSSSVVMGGGGESAAEKPKVTDKAAVQ
jgi:WD40 repeat protein